MNRTARRHAVFSIAVSLISAPQLFAVTASSTAGVTSDKDLEAGSTYVVGQRPTGPGLHSMVSPSVTKLPIIKVDGVSPKPGNSFTLPSALAGGVAGTATALSGTNNKFAPSSGSCANSGGSNYNCGFTITPVGGNCTFSNNCFTQGPQTSNTTDSNLSCTDTGLVNSWTSNNITYLITKPAAGKYSYICFRQYNDSSRNFPKTQFIRAQMDSTAAVTWSVQ